MPDGTRSTSCTACPVAVRCPPACVGGALLGPPMSLPQAGKALYGVGTPAFGIFVVRAGCLKTVTTDMDGNEHVRSFHFAGDLVGLDALGSAAYPSSAIALVPTQVCRISKGELQHLARSSPEAMQRLLEHTSRELRDALASSGNYTAEQRVASFLLSMEKQLAEQPGGNFELPMTRRDMANHLRLATETVCRVLGRFADHAWLRGGSSLKILDHGPLWDLAQPIGCCRCSSRLAA